MKLQVIQYFFAKKVIVTCESSHVAKHCSYGAALPYMFQHMREDKIPQSIIVWLVLLPTI